MCLSEGVQVHPTDTHTRSAGDALSQVLLDLGILVLSRPRREQVAAELAAAGVCEDDLRALHAYIRGVCAGEDESKAPRLLAAKVMDVANLPTVLADVRAHLAGKEAKPDAARRGEHDHGAAIRQQNVEQVRRYDAAYDAWLADVRAGRITPDWTPPSFMRRGASA